MALAAVPGAVKGSLRGPVLFASLGAGLVAAIGVAVVMAVTLAIVDIGLSGHGRPTLGRPWITQGFVRMSRADALMLAASGISALVAAAAVLRIGRARERRRAGREVM